MMKLPAVPFVTAISVTAKPVTFSLNVTVIGMEVDPVGPVKLDAMATVGATVSANVMENSGAAMLSLPAASVAAPAAILTVTAPLAAGVIVPV